MRAFEEEEEMWRYKFANSSRIDIKLYDTLCYLMNSIYNWRKAKD